MEEALKILFLEDNPHDEELSRRELSKAGLRFTARRARSRDEFVRDLQAFSPDLILLDYSLPGFGGMQALNSVRESASGTPCIIVTGSINEETAVDCIKAGAYDYVLKQNIVRLPSAVRGALEKRRLARERDKLEEQLRQSQKMEAVGRLAGGVAHDFNNILTAISGYSHFLLNSMPPEDPNRADVEEIKKAGERAASLTRQLLVFSRQQVLQPRALNVNLIVADIEKMLHRLIGEDVDLAASLAKNLGTIKADPGQIEQVIMNLVVNARDAMPHGGRLVLETANVELSAEYVSMHLEAAPGPHVMLAVSDTGHGMDATTLSRIFEPFFTTKEKGKGTGLGLSTVYGIVKQSGGSIYVYSEPGKGSTFKIYFPRVEEAAQPLRTDRPAVKAMGGSETILLVEDDEMVRKFLVRALREAGYSVLEADKPETALALFERHKERVDLLMTDIVMPGMRGDELAQRILAVRAGLKVIFISGYTEASMLRHDLLDPNVNFLQKPLNPDLLAQRLREILGTPKPKA